MSLVRGKHSKPETAVRSLVHRLGYRFRLHRRDLPGSPDIVLPKHRAVIFVHGCFWHRHHDCARTRTPKTRREFWEAKFADNVRRDASNLEALNAAGWRTLVIWECETYEERDLAVRIREFIG